MQGPFWLGDDPTEFPPIESAATEPNGLLALGGDLSQERLLCAYRSGIFPWYSGDKPILWWSPDPRAILDFDNFHVSKSLKKALKKNYQVYFDRDFEGVISHCQKPRPYEKGTWINDEIKAAYIKLHQSGYAHCVEVELDGQLLGGLYGISLGKAFFGESMFSLQTNGSKLALYYLIEKLKNWGFTWLDCQVWSEHLASLGSQTLPREQFLSLLDKALKQPGPSNWTSA